MEQTVMMAMQTCQEFAQKSASSTLSEYEMLMYEQLCNFISVFMKGHAFLLRKQVCDLERDALKAEAEHADWLKAQDDDDESAAAA